MAETLFSKAAPALIGAVNAPIWNMRIEYGVRSRGIVHSGDQYTSGRVKPYIAPVARFALPLGLAMSTIGLRFTRLTAFKRWRTQFENSDVKAGSTHKVDSLRSGCHLLASISSIGIVEDVALAECMAVFFSDDEKANPLEELSNQALPSSPSYPTLHTNGPAEFDGGRVNGLSGVSFENNPSFAIPEREDGGTFARGGSYIGARPSFRVSHNSPTSIITALGYDGTAISGDFVQYYRVFDDTDYEATSTGSDNGSLTVAQGLMQIDDDTQDGGGSIDGANVTISCDSASPATTHPVVWSATASVPDAA